MTHQDFDIDDPGTWSLPIDFAAGVGIGVILRFGVPRARRLIARLRTRPRRPARTPDRYSVAPIQHFAE